MAQLAGPRAALQVLLIIWLCGISLSYIADFAHLEVVQEPTSAHASLWKLFCVKDMPGFGVDKFAINSWGGTNDIGTRSASGTLHQRMQEGLVILNVQEPHLDCLDNMTCFCSHAEVNLMLDCKMRGEILREGSRSSSIRNPDLPERCPKRSMTLSMITG